MEKLLKKLVSYFKIIYKTDTVLYYFNTSTATYYMCIKNGDKYEIYFHGDNSVTVAAIYDDYYINEVTFNISRRQSALFLLECLKQDVDRIRK